MGAPGWFDFYWKRISRWCLLGTVVMLLWLLAPVVKCSWAAFRDTPIGEVDESSAAPGEADSARLDEGKGFVSKFTTSVKACYARTPLLGQEAWKRWLLFGFAGAMVLTGILARLEDRRRRTFTRE